MIITWLWNLVTLEIGNTVMFLPVMKEVQDSIREAYSKVKDATQSYFLTVKTW